MCDCTRKEKINFEGFTQNGWYGNQPQPFEVVFYSIEANTSCQYQNPNNSYRLVFAQHNVDLYINLRILKGQFSRQMVIAEENNIDEPGVFSDRSEYR